MRYIGEEHKLRLYCFLQLNVKCLLGIALLFERFILLKQHFLVPFMLPVRPENQEHNSYHQYKDCNARVEQGCLR